MHTKLALVLAITGLAMASSAWSFVGQAPEPNSLALFGAGIASAILIARYLKKK